MAFGGIKTYNLVLLDFDQNKYFIFSYQKDRRLTANQAWKFIKDNKPEIEGKLPAWATIEDYYTLVKNHDLNPKYSDRYMRFRGFK